MKNERYWIAINGATCALCSLPLREPFVTPTPEQLLGFPTVEEAERAQRICLFEPKEDVNRFLRRLAHDVKAKRIRYIRPEHPQPPSREATAWTESDEAHGIMQQAFITGNLN